MKVVALVPIKMNSERLKNKNILPLGGHPLAWHIFTTLSNVPEISEIYAFCSDAKIRNYVPENILFLQRSTELDGSLVRAENLYEAFIQKVDADIYVVAHTTAPFIRAKTIEHALKKVLNEGYDSAFAVQKKQTFAWFEGRPLNYTLKSIPRTQDMEPVFIETSGFFIFNKEVFTQLHQRIGQRPFMQEVDDIEAVDIDEPEDYLFAKKLWNIQEEKT